MDVGQVRSFNRIVAARIGALQDSYLATGRPLGADRVLWEIGDGTDLRTLRARLGLDSGYLSRIVARLQREGLVATTPGADKRVREVTLDGQGRVAARGARPPQRRARRGAARPAHLPTARTAHEAMGDGRAAAERRAGRDRGRGPGRRGRALLPGAVLRRARGPLRGRLRPGREPARGRRAAARRPPARGADRLRRDQARLGLHQAHVGASRTRVASAWAAACCTSSSSARPRPWSSSRPTAA